MELSMSERSLDNAAADQQQVSFLVELDANARKVTGLDLLLRVRGIADALQAYLPHHQKRAFKREGRDG
jgi:hypothetical protein